MHSALTDPGFLLHFLRQDIFPVLALAYRTCHRLDRIICEEMITPSVLASFLRQHQYALLHDNYHRHFTPQEMTLLWFVFGRLQSQYPAPVLFDTLAEFLGPLISRTPADMFCKSPPLSPDFELEIPRDGRRKAYSVIADDVLFHYRSVLGTPWMYTRWFLEAHSDSEVLDIVNQIEPHPVLKPDFLLSKKYIDLCTTAHSLNNRALTPFKPFLKSPEGVIQHVQELMSVDACPPSPTITLLIRKWCIASYLDPGISDGIISWEAYRSLVQSRGWTGLWTLSEHGTWLALGLRQFGEEKDLKEMVARTFPLRRERLLWLFLGAHGWFHTKERRQYVKYTDDETKVCCDFFHSRGGGLQDQFVRKELEGLENEDKVWIGVEAVRRAPEFGVCRDLGATLFTYLVKEGEDDHVFAAIVEEICGSRMQVLFEHSLGLAIGNCEEGKLPRTTTKTRQLKDKLKVLDGELFQLLNGGVIVRRNGFYV
jgi:hypothetical protein